MIDVDTYIKSIHLKWIKKIFETKEANWTIIPKVYLNKIGSDLIFSKMNLNKSFIDKNIWPKIPQFYQELIKTWLSVGGGTTSYPKNYLDIRKQVIWGNKFIKFEGKCLCFNSWIDSGLIFVNDIIDNEDLCLIRK